MRKVKEIFIPNRQLIKDFFLKRKRTSAKASGYYEFLNKVKIMCGSQALENIANELRTRGASRPMLVTYKNLADRGIANMLIKALKLSELPFQHIFICPDVPAEAQQIALAASEFKSFNCDAILLLGDGSAFEFVKEIMNAVNSPIPFMAVPTGNWSAELTGWPDVLILDPRMTLHLAPRDIALMAISSLSHAIETYTCEKKNPLSDAYAFSAISLIRANLETALKNPGDRNARLSLVNAAMLSGIGVMNSPKGIIHAIAHTLAKIYKVSRTESIGILLTHCMEYQMIRHDELYGELLLPLAGADIYADTLRHERGRKTIQTIRNMISEYHGRYGIPVYLSETGVKRSDFDAIAGSTSKNRPDLYNLAQINEEDIKNILNMSF